MVENKSEMKEENGGMVAEVSCDQIYQVPSQRQTTLEQAMEDLALFSQSLSIYNCFYHKTRTI